MKIDDNLALTFQVCGKDAYHTPLSKAAFEASYRLIANTKASLFDTSGNALVTDGPRLALLILKDEGAQLAAKRGEDGDGGAHALIAELTRLTMIASATPDGLDLVPVQNAGLDSEEWEESLSALVFFTCNYALAMKSERKQKMDALSAILNFGITSLSAEDWLAGCGTLTKGATTSKKAASSVPV